MFLLAVAAGLDPAAAQFRSTDRVDLISVEVGVTDPEGRFISGLHAADFRVLEDGVEQAVTHFEEVGAAATGDGSAPPAAIGRDLLVFIDVYHSGPVDSKRILDRLRAALPDLAATGVRTSIASYDGTLTIHTPPTAERDRIAQALDRVAANMVRPIEPPAEASHPRQLASLLEERIGWFEDSLEAAMRAMPRSGVRRVALVVTPGRTFRNELEKRPHACTTLECLSRKASWLAAYGAMEQMGVLSRASHVATELGFTLFAVDASDLSVEDEAKERRWSLRRATTLTGGTARLHGDVAGAIADVAKRTTAYYVVAYEADTPGDGRFHTILVDVPTRPDLTLTFRSRYVDRPDEDRRAAALLSELLAGTGAEQLGAAITTGPASRRTALLGGVASLARVPIVIRVPLARVTLLPEGETARGSVFLVAYASEQWAQRSAVHRRAIPIELPVADLSRARAGYWKYTFEMEVEASSPSLHVGVADAISGASTTADLPLAAPHDEVGDDLK